MGTTVTLMEKIKAKQREAGLTETAFAEKASVGRSNWYLIQRGLRKPTAEFLGAVMRAFPELTVDILQYLREGGSHD